MFTELLTEVGLPLWYGESVAGFPHDMVPDGIIHGPHHFLIGVGIAALLAWGASRGRGPKRSIRSITDRTAILTMGTLSVSAFSWFTLWGGPSPFYGAVGTLAGLAGAVASLLWSPFWDKWEWTNNVPLPEVPSGGVPMLPAQLVTRVVRACIHATRLVSVRSVTLFWVLVATDDAIEHAFGVWTPCDWFWNTVLHPYLTEAARWLATVL